LHLTKGKKAEIAWAIATHGVAGYDVFSCSCGSGTLLFLFLVQE